MSERTKEISLRTSPLEEEHRAHGAIMTEGDGCPVPSSFGDTRVEYNAVRTRGAGLVDFSCRGLLSVSGSEAIQFLNGLITNDMKTLAENHWMPAVFPNVQGRLIASVRVVRLNDSDGVPTFLIDTEGATFEAVLTTLKRFTLAGDFRVADHTSDMTVISVQGTQAETVVTETLGGEAADLGQHQTQQVDWKGNKLAVIRSNYTAEDGFDIFVPSALAVEFWRALRQAGATPVGFDALEVLRVEAGVARYGIDMDASNVVSETNLDAAVSFTKGCYVGQEIIARIKYRGHVAKKLTGIRFEDDAPIDRGATIVSQDKKEIGRVTSVAFSPALNCTIALGYVKYDYLAPGTQVEAVSGDKRHRGFVTDLPFVPEKSTSQSNEQ